MFFELFLKEQLNITGKVLVMFPAATDMRQVTLVSYLCLKRRAGVGRLPSAQLSVRN